MSFRQCRINQFPYVIQPGDTLYKIAIRLNTSVPAIIAANPGIDPNLLYAGQTICIPACPANNTVVFIRPGDTLYKIAQAYNVSIDSLTAANPGVDPYRLAVGQRICVPPGCPFGYATYIVRSGDTLYSIAAGHSLTTGALIAANPTITNPALLTVGQRVCIPQPDAIREQIGKMTIDEKIGQMVIAGFGGYTLNDQVRTLIRNYHAGGFIIYGGNVQNAAQLSSLINSLKSANSVNKTPLFISVDEEGGRVSRLPPELSKFPSALVIGRANSGPLAFRVGNAIATVLKAFGFNMDFAPVLDINSNPNNPIIGDRAFGSSAEIVSRLGVQMMHGIQAGGVIPVVKHFPGHGDTAVDPHIGLPVVYNDLNRLWSLELIPFYNAIRNGADAVMVAHILLPRIDTVFPSSMSPTVINGLLRGQMGFNGVVITDDMAMGAIVRNFDISYAAVQSINAGSDIILVSGGYNNEIRILNALKNAVINGTIPAARINESIYRIIRLKRKYGLSDTPSGPANVTALNNEIEAVNAYFR